MPRQEGCDVGRQNAASHAAFVAVEGGDEGGHGAVCDSARLLRAQANFRHEHRAQICQRERPFLRRGFEGSIVEWAQGAILSNSIIQYVIKNYQ